MCAVTGERGVGEWVEINPRVLDRREGLARGQWGPPLGMKIEFDEFFGLLRSRAPFPFFYGIDRGFCQHGTAANNLSELHFSVGRNHGFHSDGASDLHFTG